MLSGLLCQLAFRCDLIIAVKFFVSDLVLKLLPGFTVSVGFSLFITVTVLHYPQPDCADSVGFSLCITVRKYIGHGDLSRHVLLFLFASHCLSQ